MAGPGPTQRKSTMSCWAFSDKMPEARKQPNLSTRGQKIARSTGCCDAVSTSVTRYDGSPAYDSSDGRTCLVHLARYFGGLRYTAPARNDVGGTGSRAPRGGLGPRFSGAAHAGR